jgi:invasion protein IalB
VVPPTPVPAPASLALENANPRPPTGPPRRTEGHSAWVKVCQKTQVTEKDEKKDLKICLNLHERIDSNTGMVLVSAALRQVEGRQTPHFMVMVPLGMMQSVGLRVGIYPDDLWEKAQKSETVDEGRIYKLKLNFTLCHPAGCTAETEASPDTIEWLNRAGGITVTAINASGSPVSFPVSLNGFASALAGEPVDNKKYDADRKKLMEQIAERQKELKRQADKKK